MINLWIIEELRKVKEKKKAERPMLRLPVPEYIPCEEKKEDVKSDRGVITINYGDDDEES